MSDTSQKTEAHIAADSARSNGQDPTGAAPRRERGRAFLVAHTWAFALFALLYVMPGIVGHEPWKQDETYIVEIVRSMVASGDWLVPTMAGEAFMEKPPLFYWVAAGLAKLLSPVLPFHDAARLATALFLLITCAAVAYGGRRWRDRDFGRTAVLALLGCIGMQVYAHLMLTDIALLAGFAIGISGLACWQDAPMRSGLQIGTGIGIGFLAKGLMAPGVFAVTALLLPVCFSHWRRWSYARMAGAALLAALPWLLIWPARLYLRSPSLFSDWLWLNNIGRFLGFAVPALGAAHDDGFWSENLIWIAFPAAPLALLTLRRAGHAIRADEMLQANAIFSLVILGVLLFSASARGGYALPLLVPLSLLGAASVGSLPPAAENWGNRTARTGFTLLALLVWLAWAGIMWGGSALGIPILRDQLAPDLDRHVDGAAVGISVLASLAAAFLMWHPRRQLALQTWVVGIATCWLLLASLFLPWVDQVKSYKAVLGDMSAALTLPVNCVASRGLGESERAMLSYYHGLITERLEATRNTKCRVLLVEGLRVAPPNAVDERTWTKIWEGSRPADDREHFWLYQRARARLSAR